MSVFGNLGGNTNPPAGSLFGNAAANNTSGNNTNTTAPGSGLFGTTASTPAPATGGIFGGAPANPPATGGGLFGGASTATAAATPTGGLFGGTTPASGATGSNIFGKTNSAPAAPTGGLFGTSSNTPATTTPGTGLFGTPIAAAGTSTPAASGTTPAPAGSLVSAFGPIKAADSSAPKPGAGLFGQIGTTNTANTPAAPATGGGLFGSLAPASTTASTAPSTAAPSGSLFGGGLFGKQSDAPAAGTAAAPAGGATTSTTGSTLPPFNLTGNKDAAATATTTAGSSAPATGGLFGLGGATAGAGTSKPEEKKDGAAPTPALSLFGAAKKDTPAAADKSNAPAPAASTSTALSTTISVPPPSMLRGKTIDEIVNLWTSELDKHLQEFNLYAGEVAVWDRALIDNSKNLSALFGAALAAEREQADIDQSLEHIEQQQKDLESTLDAYEKLAGDTLGAQGGGSLRALDTGPADTERDKNYMLATELHGHLDDLSSSLTQMIESVNELSLAPAGGADDKSEDAMGQITAILSSHLESLQWIDGATRELETKVGDVEKRIRASEGLSAPGGSGTKTRGFGVVGR